jgi:hypothetical protein
MTASWRRHPLIAFLAMLLFSSHAPTPIGGAAQEVQTPKDQKPASTMEDAVRAWDKGFSSDKKETRLETLRAMWPTQHEIEYLFPKHAGKLWPIFQEGLKFVEENVDELTQEITRGGAIKKVKAIDVRTDKELSTGSYKRILEIIPKDVGVFDWYVEREKGSGGGGTYLQIKGRWFWIKDAYLLPDFLDKLDKPVWKAFDELNKPFWEELKNETCQPKPRLESPASEARWENCCVPPSGV